MGSLLPDKHRGVGIAQRQPAAIIINWWKQTPNDFLLRSESGRHFWSSTGSLPHPPSKVNIKSSFVNISNFSTWTEQGEMRKGGKGLSESQYNTWRNALARVCFEKENWIYFLWAPVDVWAGETSFLRSTFFINTPVDFFTALDLHSVYQALPVPPCEAEIYVLVSNLRHCISFTSFGPRAVKCIFCKFQSSQFHSQWWLWTLWDRPQNLLILKNICNRCFKKSL